MVKYYCDVCGKELRLIERIKIPTDLDVEKTKSLTTSICLSSATKLLCVECYSNLQERYERLLKAVMEKN